MKTKLTIKPQQTRLSDLSEKRDFEKQVLQVLSGFSDYELARKRAAYAQRKAIDNLHKLLIAFEAEAIKNGLKVLWAQHADDVYAHTKQLIGKYETKGLRMSTHGLFEELGLEERFQKKDWMNASAKLTMSAATFMFSDAGSVLISSSEAPSISDKVKAHVILVPVDAMLSSINDFELFTALHHTNRYASMQAPFSQLISAPYKNAAGNEVDVFIMLVDNGRSDMLTNPVIRGTASCIQCNSCANSSEVDNAITELLDAGTYCGPLALVAGQYLATGDEPFPVSLAILSGKAYEMCPVNIPVHEIILQQRQIDVEQQGMMSRGEKFRMAAWKRMMTKRSALNSTGSGTRSFMLKSFFKSAWGAERDFPKLAEKSFNELWRERYTRKK